MSWKDQDYSRVVVVEESDTITVDSPTSITSLNTKYDDDTYCRFPDVAIVQPIFKMRLPIIFDGANYDTGGWISEQFSLSDIEGKRDDYKAGNFINIGGFVRPGPTNRIRIEQGSGGIVTLDNTALLGDIPLWCEGEKTATQWIVEVYSDEFSTLLDILIVTLTDPPTQDGAWDIIQSQHAYGDSGAFPTSSNVGVLQFEDNSIILPNYPAEEETLLNVVYGNENQFTGTLLKFGVDTDPNDPLRQRIVDTVLARMATILISGGFKTDGGTNVFDWQEFALDMGRFPEGVYTFRDMDNDPIQATVGLVDNFLQCSVTAYAPPGSTSKAQGRLMIADFIQMVFADETWGGLAFDTQIPDEEPEFEQLAEEQWAATLPFIIEFTTPRGSAYAQT